MWMTSSSLSCSNQSLLLASSELGAQLIACKLVSPKECPFGLLCQSLSVSLHIIILTTSNQKLWAILRTWEGSWTTQVDYSYYNYYGRLVVWTKTLVFTILCTCITSNLHRNWCVQHFWNRQGSCWHFLRWELRCQQLLSKLKAKIFVVFLVIPLSCSKLIHYGSVISYTPSRRSI